MRKMRIWKSALVLVLSAVMALAPIASVLTCSMPVYAEETIKNHAILIYLKNDSGLGDVPRQDTEAIAATLRKTDQFQENVSSIETFGIELNSNVDALYDSEKGLLTRLDAIAEGTDEDSFTVIYYSGHGGGGKDGTSYLAMGGANNITAAELKSHLRKFKGKVLVMLDACYSGGMIMPASTEDDENTETSSSPFDAENFAEQLYGNESSASNGTDEPAQLYFISASNGAETAWQDNTCGGQLGTAFENAMGHDRCVPEYKVYAADTSTLSGVTAREGYSGDGQITMTELAAYYRRTAMKSTPVIYPEQDDTALFTYSQDEGTPAAIISSLCDVSGDNYHQNIKYDAEKQQIVFTVNIQNLTNADIKVRVATTPWWNNTITALEPNEQTGKANYVQWVDDDVDTIPAGTSKNITNTFSPCSVYGETEDVTKNPFTLRVWVCDKESKSYRNYNQLSFYTSLAEDNGEIAADELRMQSPTEMSVKDTDTDKATSVTVTKTSGIVPVRIVYDNRDVNKETNAPCSLSLYAYDLGEDMPEDICIDSSDSGVLKTFDGETVVGSTSARTMVFENVQPNHEGTSGNDSLRDSVHTYILNTTDSSKWEVGHYYALRVQCDYENNKYPTHYLWAIIQKVTAEEADKEAYQIPAFTFSKDNLSYFWTEYNGIPLESWDNSIAYTVDRTVQNVQYQLNEMMGWYNRENGLFNYANSDWCRYNAETGEWDPMSMTDTFEAGNKYRCKLTIEIDEKYNAVFTSGTKFEFYHHNIIGDAVILETLGDDAEPVDRGKYAEIWLEHEIPEVNENALKLYEVVDGEEGEEITLGTTLHLGDQVILRTDPETYVYNWKLWEGLKKTDKKITTEDGSYDVFEVVKSSSKDKTAGSVEIEVWNSGNRDGSKAADSCGCATDWYVWKVDYSDSDPEEETSGGGASGSWFSDSESSGSSSSDSNLGGSSSSSDQTSQETPAATGTTSTLNYICSENQMANYLTAGGGIPVGTGWNAGSVAGVNSQVQNNLFQLFLTNTMGSRYNQQVTWSQYDAGTGVETVLGSGATFQMGQQYVSTVTISVPNGSSERFNASSSFKFGNHKLLGNPVISADGKTATVKVLHTVPQMDENAIKLYMADTGAEITADTQLQPGDLVRISAADGYGYYILGGLRASGTDGVYTVEYCQSASGVLGGIEIMFYLKEQLAGCNCGTLLYKHAVGDVGGYGQVVSLSQSGSSVKGTENGTSVVSLGLVNGQTYSRGGAVGGTGDEGRLILWLLLSVSSAAGLAEIYLLESRRRAVRRRKTMRRRTQR